MNGNVIIYKNAKKEEIKAYYVLKDIFFNDKDTVVGDDISKGLPDIFTEDYSIGVEVTSCEHISQFLKENKKTLTKEEITNLVNYYDNLSLKDKNLFFNGEFENILEKKIRKIGNYKSCKSINLIIMSDNEDKHFIRRESLAKIYRNLVEKYKKKYDNIFLYYNDCLYVEINGQFMKLKKIKFNSREWER